MKTFSELLDIDSSLQVYLQLGAITDNGIPDLQVVVNDEELYSDRLMDVVTLTTAISVTDSLHIEICMSGKEYCTQKETAIRILAICCDEVDALPLLIPFARYTNDHNNTQPTAYLGFNGCWAAKINQPFYQWLHQQTGQGWLLEPGKTAD